MTEEKIDALARAAQHVVEAKNIVARQHERISRLRASGCSTLGAEEMLSFSANTFRRLRNMSANFVRTCGIVSRPSRTSASAVNSCRVADFRKSKLNPGVSGSCVVVSGPLVVC
jgi:hypothetical protein